MPDWKDFASLLCLALVLLAVAALVTAAQTFAIVRGKVVTTGTAIVDSNGTRTSTRTVTVAIENADRVFHIAPGTLVEYAISDSDAGLLEVGSSVELLVTLHSNKARLVEIAGGPRL